MTTNNFNKDYWENRYKSQNTGWDIGHIAKPIQSYIDQLKDKDIEILIPGAGNSYEAEYLWQMGFKNVNLIDVAQQPLLNFKTRVKDFPNKQLINDNFFNLEGTYDLIIEQTFFCALDPSLRKNYRESMISLLKPKAKLIGLFFNFECTENGPPFGGSKKEYTTLFKEKFNIKVLEKSYNSIEARKDKELFFIFEKK